MESSFIYSFASAFVISLISFVGLITLPLKKKQLHELLLLLVGFSAGALMGGALIHLMPEALELTTSEVAFSLLISGFITFFLLEKMFFWHHCHEGKCDVHPFAYLNLVGDGIHNFVDGVVIAASFATSINIGIISSLAIVFHEIPQELGDLGVLLYAGLTRNKALFYNFLSALTAVLGVIAGYIIIPYFDITPYALPFAAGGFIYISASDLIPELHKETDKKKSMMSFATFLLGLAFMQITRMLFK